MPLQTAICQILIKYFFAPAGYHIFFNRSMKFLLTLNIKKRKSICDFMKELLSYNSKFPK